jgi:hypothetical protein
VVSIIVILWGYCLSIRSYDSKNSNFEAVLLLVTRLLMACFLLTVLDSMINAPSTILLLLTLQWISIDNLNKYLAPKPLMTLYLIALPSLGLIMSPVNAKLAVDCCSFLIWGLISESQR